MNKKIYISALILLVLFFGCVEDKIKNQKEYEIELKSHDFDFENEKISFEVYSESELQKTRFEVLDEEKKIECLEYLNLSKGKNNISFDCPVAGQNLFLEITPSDGKIREFELELEARKISLKDGFKYYFEYYDPESNNTFDLNIFIIDENKDFFKGISYFLKENIVYFDLFLLDKNSFEFYTGGVKENCKEAYNSVLQKEKDQKGEYELIFPFVLYYMQKEGEFNLSSFVVEKQYFLKTPSIESEIKITKKEILNSIETYKAEYKISKEMAAEFYFQDKAPYIIIYYETPDGSSIRFKKEVKEEFDEKKYSCFGG